MDRRVVLNLKSGEMERITSEYCYLICVIDMLDNNKAVKKSTKKAAKDNLHRNVLTWKLLKKKHAVNADICGEGTTTLDVGRSIVREASETTVSLSSPEQCSSNCEGDSSHFGKLGRTPVTHSL
ncbi:hypothetical protein KIN20_023569 [Parelaphostrongylus tenuis]|uniref:Uncharacterized protein n=1 Tax=Parelaphostrongylus tenuis TaxID=148309 RepID=A0AAD5QVX6_PARTN|nr:hypothetical protein KIN20_023569 [Parelaphostrongylus tenuis]